MPLLFAYGINRFSHDLAHMPMVFSSASYNGRSIIDEQLPLYVFPRDRTPASQDVCVQCMVDLLKDLQNDGTAGEFLIYMLQVQEFYINGKFCYFPKIG